MRIVIEDNSPNRMTCSCRKFESYGIICRHIFAAFPKMQLYAPLPDMYVLRRWTKSAKSIASTSIGSSDHSIVMHHNELRKLASSVVEAALVNYDTYIPASEHLESHRCKLNTMTPTDSGQSSASIIDASKRVYNEPEKVRAKGCGKRLKGGMEEHDYSVAYT
ncbi:protein FAR1-RELATED SEQUENCE 9-like [Tripterygium wilfordii]|uniref:protein FAR1-RELATED SEQUENCE 9-like n=1 Tax=Tripterygium wilfordii TaxID=458696 RepID=UPI0018F86086|nr:protein FAR1-RELATED SEQUENCE 9-like [Tripterygium wilfordii]